MKGQFKGQGLNDLAAPRNQGGPWMQEKGTIASELGGHCGQGVFLDAQRATLVDGHQGVRAIGTPSAKPRAHRDDLVKVDVQPRQIVGFKQQLMGPHHQIVRCVTRDRKAC